MLLFAALNDSSSIQLKADAHRTNNSMFQHVLSNSIVSTSWHILYLTHFAPFFKAKSRHIIIINNNKITYQQLANFFLFNKLKCRFWGNLLKSWIRISYFFFIHLHNDGRCEFCDKHILFCVCSSSCYLKYFDWSLKLRMEVHLTGFQLRMEMPSYFLKVRNTNWVDI